MNDALMGLLKRETGDEVVVARLQVASEIVEKPAEVWAAVRSFAPEQGWLCLTDRVAPLYVPADLDGLDGIILSGELVSGTESLHLRQTENGWRLTRLAAGTGDDCLMYRENYIGTENGQSDRLQYEVYWKRDGSSYRPYAGRLSGLSKEGGQR